VGSAHPTGLRNLRRRPVGLVGRREGEQNPECVKVVHSQFNIFELCQTSLQGYNSVRESCQGQRAQVLPQGTADIIPQLLFSCLLS
jgi:hypothetical protein